MRSLLLRLPLFSSTSIATSVVCLLFLCGPAYSFTVIKLIAPELAKADFHGTSVALSGDFLASGAPRQDEAAANAGAVYIHERTVNNTWVNTAKVLADDASSIDYFGTAVAMDGDTLVVGAHGNDNSGLLNSGAVYVFVRSGGVWSQQQKLTPILPQAGSYFGSAVAISGNTIVVGAADYDNGTGADSGQAFVYSKIGSTWTEVAQLVPEDASADQLFGFSVAVNGSEILVGAPEDNPGGINNAGAAYLFTYSDGSWSQLQKVIASDPGAADFFGGAVSIDGDELVVGSHNDDPSGSNSGSAYVFEKSASVWNQVSKLTASDGGANDKFGISVDIDDGKVAIGATLFDISSAKNVGAVYIFEQVAASWTQTRQHMADDAAGGDRFGGAVSVSSGLVAIGASYDDNRDDNNTNYLDSGSVYILDLIEDVTEPDWGNAALTSSNITDSSVDLSWDAAIDDVAVAGYRLYLDGAVIYDLASTSVTVPDLAPDTSYAFKIEAYDAAGNETFDGPQEIVSTLAAADTTPPVWVAGSISISNETAASLDVVWSGAVDDTAVVDYQLNIDDGIDPVQTIVVASSPTTVTGLTADTSYTITVQARDSSGNTSIDGPVGIGTTTSISDTNPPFWTSGILTLENGTQTTLDASWSGAMDDVGVTEYLISADDGVNIPLSFASSTSPLTLSGLQPGTSYTITVQARDAAGNESIDGPGETGVTTAFSDTEPPLWSSGTLTVSNETQSTLELSWSGASDNVGIVEYEVSYDDGGGAQSVTTSAQSTVLTGLASGTTYMLTVQARDAAGNESVDGPEATGATTSGNDVLAPIWSASAAADTTMLSSSSAALTLTGASDDTAVTGYRVYDGTTLLTEVAGSPAAVTGLSSDTTYTLRVEAIDAVGNESVGGPMVTLTTLNGEQVKLLAAAPNSQDYMGASVALDGNRAVIGVSHEDGIRNNSGEIRVYEQSGGEWLPVAQLKASDPNANDNFGFVGLGLSGDTILAGAWHSDPLGWDSGAAYVFTREGGVWSQQQKLVASDGSSGDDFGRTVAIDGDLAAIGARDHGSAGAVYVFSRSGGVWSEAQKLVASDISAGQFFGSDVAISGNRIVVGSRGATHSGVNGTGTSRTRAGAAYVFVFSGGVWQEEAKLVAADYFQYDEFGTAVDIEDELIVVTAPKDDDNGSNSGSAYWFEYDGTQWLELDKKSGSDSVSADFFGISAALDNGVTVLGSYLHDAISADTGAVYVFARSGSNWIETDKIVAGDGSSGDHAGTVVALSGNTVLFGAENAAYKNVSAAGAAYIAPVNTTVNDTEAPVWTAGSLIISNETETTLDVAWSGATDNTAVVEYELSVDDGINPVLMLTVAGSPTTVNGLTAQTSYTITVQARDAAGNESIDGPSETGVTTAFSDTEPPLWSSGTLTVSNETQSTLELSWSGASDNVGIVEYEVSYDDGGGAQSVTTSAQSTVLTGLTSGTTYMLTVQARDAAGNESVDGPEATGATTSGNDVFAPVWSEAQIVVSNLTPSSMDLSWSGASDNTAVAGYRIYDHNGVLLADTVSTTYSVAGLSAGEFRFFRVEAYDAEANQSTTGPEIGGPFPFDKLIGKTASDGDLFGGAVAIDGDTAVATALDRDLPVAGVLKSSVGEATVLSLVGDTWQAVALLAADDGSANDDFGYDVDIDGNTIIVGAWHADISGQQNAGAAYVFTGSGANWTQQMKLVSSTPQNGADFGVGVAIDGDIAVVGAQDADFAGISATGEVSVFRRNGSGVWTLDEVLRSDFPQADQAFGRSVSIHGGRIVVGAPLEDITVSSSTITNGGAIYVFEEIAGSWTQRAKLSTADIAAYDLLGESVEIENDTIIGTAKDDDNGSNSGAGYVFEFDGATWVESGKLVASDGAGGDRLGFRASISGDIIAMGAYRHDVGTQADAGAAYLWQRTIDGNWLELDQYSAFDGQAQDYYGISVAISGTTLLVGSENDDHTGLELDVYFGSPDGTHVTTNNAGSVYFYKVP